MTGPDCPWRCASPPPELAAGEIHVWCMALDVPNRPAREFFSCLSADEQQRAGRFRFDRDRRHFIACRGRLREILSHYQDVAPGEIRFQYGPNGKPVIAESSPERPIHFNVSNSRGLALAAFSRLVDLGVDVEYVRPVKDLQQLADRYFSPREQAALASLPLQRRKEAFFRVWTCKEAVLKAVGTGLSFPLNRIDVSADPSEPARLSSFGEDPAEAERWSLEALDPAPGYAAALAWRGDSAQVSRWFWRR